jgi:hypothetical protein
MRTCCRTLTGVLAAIACVMMVSPSAALAESVCANASVGPSKATNVVVDVALQDGGVLVGQVFNSAGMTRANVPLMIRDRMGRNMQVEADGMGVFTVKNVQGGIYQIRVGNTVAAYRLWAPGTAPPAARSGVVLVDNQQVSRGQGKGRSSVFRHPWAITSFVAAAIIIPIAVTNEGSGS